MKQSENMVLEAVTRLSSVHDALEELLAPSLPSGESMSWDLCAPAREVGGWGQRERERERERTEETWCLGPSPASHLCTMLLRSFWLPLSRLVCSVDKQPSLARSGIAKCSEEGMTECTTGFVFI
jgi:hypothetical protein